MQFRWRFQSNIDEEVSCMLSGTEEQTGMLGHT